MIKLSDIISEIEYNKARLGITLYKKARPKDISEFRKKKGICLPEDFIEFYSFSNGFHSKEDEFRIVPLDEIVEKGPDDYLINSNDFHFAEYMLYCDMWSLYIHPDKLIQFIILRNRALY